MSYVAAYQPLHFSHIGSGEFFFPCDFQHRGYGFVFIHGPLPVDILQYRMLKIFRGEREKCEEEGEFIDIPGRHIPTYLRKGEAHPILKGYLLPEVGNPKLLPHRPVGAYTRGCIGARMTSEPHNLSLDTPRL